MGKNVKLKLLSLLGVFVLVLVFVLVSYFIQNNFYFFEELISGNFWGLLTYVFLNFVGIVVAPVTVIPLVVIVTEFWGPVVAGFATLAAWVLGSVVAFLLARGLGVPIIKRFISLEDLYKFEERFSFLESFWGIVFLRMVVPVEILSYGLGLFSKIGFWKYISATALGLAPVAFAFGFLGIIPFAYQIVLALCILIVFLVLMIFREIVP